MQNSLNNKEQQEFDDILAGSISGGLFAHGINIEGAIVTSLLNIPRDFDLLIRILSILSIIISILWLSFKYKKFGKYYGAIIFLLSFFGMFLMLISLNFTNAIPGFFLLVISADMVVSPDKWVAIRYEKGILNKILKLFNNIFEIILKIGKKASVINKKQSYQYRQVLENIRQENIKQRKKGQQIGNNIINKHIRYKNSRKRYRK